MISGAGCGQLRLSAEAQQGPNPETAAFAISKPDVELTGNVSVTGAFQRLEASIVGTGRTQTGLGVLGANCAGSTTSIGCTNAGISLSMTESGTQLSVFEQYRDATVHDFRGGPIVPLDSSREEALASGAPFELATDLDRDTNELSGHLYIEGFIPFTVSKSMELMDSTSVSGIQGFNQVFSALGPLDFANDDQISVELYRLRASATGIGSPDSDGDGVPDDQDQCLGDDASGDTDGDGVCDDSDTCPTDPLNADDDADGICDVVDFCIGDNSTGDTDGDQVCEDIDICIGNDAAQDTDEDDYCDDVDLCPVDWNPDQADTDGDGVGDACEADSDQDGVIDDLDNCDLIPNVDQADNEGDGVGDVCDPDDDNDGRDDGEDNCPLVFNAPGWTDTDGDGAGDACDGDDDGDGIADESDLCPGTSSGVPIDADGCSGLQLVQAVGSPCDYANAGRFRSEVVAVANAARDSGLLSNSQRASLVRSAAQDSCP